MALTTDRIGSPIKVTGTTDTSTEIYPVTAMGIHVKHVDWIRPTTAGHKFALQDGKGRVFCSGECEADGYGQIKPVFQPITGIFCDDLDSGTLYIYYR